MTLLHCEQIPFSAPQFTSNNVLQNILVRIFHHVKEFRELYKMSRGSTLSYWSVILARIINLSHYLLFTYPISW